jgi:hypothetical protein
MQKPGTMSQVKSGLRLAALTLAGLGIAGLFFAGVDYLFFPNGHSRVVGMVFFIFSAPIMVAIMDRWMKVMAGVLGLAVLNGLLSISTGHLLANPTQPVSRLDMVYFTLFFGLAAVLAGTLKGRKLTALDRTSVMAFLFSLACWFGYRGTRSVHAPPNEADFILMGICLGCLLVAWAYDRLKGRPGRNLAGHHVGGPAGSPADPI